MDNENYLGILLAKKGAQYYIIKQIGEGATSLVYYCLDKDNKEYAIKLYKNSESYLNEVSRLKNLIASKYIVKLMSYGQGQLGRGYSYYSYKLFNHFDSDKVNYCIYEYLKNSELHNYIFLIKKRFTEDIARKIFFDIVKGVEVCHKSGITHGDIKLQNLLFNSNFNVKLIDFGFAKNIKDGLISEITGTRFYNAPEMFCCATKGYDGVMADIFSLGVVLFVLVMGFYPFDKPNITDSRYKFILKKDFPNFWKKCEQKLFSMSSNTTVSEEFKDLFSKMVCNRPKDRISINEIKSHPWLKELNTCDCEQEEKINLVKSNNKKEISPKKEKKKVRHLSNNPSFDKGDKHNIENKSNYSDGFQKVKLDKNSLLNINTELENETEKENGVKNKIKEFDIKYQKELQLRKLSIDKILKEQEEDID